MSGQRRVRGGASCLGGALGAALEALAHGGSPLDPGNLDQPSGKLITVGALEQRAFGAFEKRGRIGAVNLPVGACRGCCQDRRQSSNYEPATHTSKDSAREADRVGRRRSSPVGGPSRQGGRASPQAREKKTAPESAPLRTPGTDRGFKN